MHIPQSALGIIRKTTALVAMTGLLWPMVLPAQQPSPGYTFKANSELVLVNVSVRDKSGNLVKDLKPEDFTVLEDNKPQKVATFDIENTQNAPQVPMNQANLLSTPPVSATHLATSASVAGQPDEAIKDRRLIILFFDLSAMQPDEIERSTDAAQDYLKKQMQPADLVSVVSLSNSLTVNQDFTSDRDKLMQVLQAFNTGANAGFELGSTGTTEGTADTAGSFTVDDTEYNIFNTDMRLHALRAVAEQVANVPQKKSLIYFSSGMQRTGIENQSELRAAINAAVIANLSIYTLDIRGLQALVPGGEAQSASLRGTSAYSGQAQLNALNSNFQTQETLVTLAADTGGKAFLDSNDFGKVFKSVQDDTSMYYLLGYHSTNTARDGKYRRITVRVNRPGVKIDFRRGYYAQADFRHSNKDDRERQLQEELTTDLPSTDLPVYLATGYFRMSDDRFYVPISLIVPGSEIPFSRNRDQDKATLDVLGLVTDDRKFPAGQIRDTIKLAVNAANEVQRKNVQYDTGMTLPSGKYHLKVVVRENEDGRMGSFETDFVVPDLKTSPVKMSSILMASQLQTAPKKDSGNPLVRNGEVVVPSVTRVFSANQHLYLYYEVYDAGKETAPAAGNGAKAEKPGVRVMTNVAFFQGNAKTYETPVVRSQEVTVPGRKAVVFQLDVPLSQLKPGFYTCQINVIDDAAGRFVFPRLAMLVRQ
ncbi:MAG: VWA domain-containing protein [Candidatus Korobacteraceae bacterium]